jgi:hypothetical protein
MSTGHSLSPRRSAGGGMSTGTQRKSRFKRFRERRAAGGGMSTGTGKLQIGFLVLHG